MRCPTVRERLWATDFDGTLYGGPRRTARLSDAVLATIADWLEAGHWFQVLSGGSMAGLARDGFDFLPAVHRVLEGRGRSDAGDLIARRVSFAMSNGAERYSVADPCAAIEAGQLSYQSERSATVNAAEVERGCALMRREFGITELARDVPFAGRTVRSAAGVCAVFLVQRCGEADEPVERTVARVNGRLEEINCALHILFVRESREGGTLCRRFDGFARSPDWRSSKAGVARDCFTQFQSVIYTGDQPTGNDQPVFEFMRNRAAMTAIAVGGPDDVVDAIRARC